VHDLDLEAQQELVLLHPARDAAQRAGELAEVGPAARAADLDGVANDLDREAN
jgi:hypothetical protein